MSMKLRCKIKKNYLDQIVSGEKQVEYRQIESIIFECEGKEYEFEVEEVKELSGADEIASLKQRYPDINWSYSLPTIAIELGKRKK